MIFPLVCFCNGAPLGLFFKVTMKNIPPRFIFKFSYIYINSEIKRAPKVKVKIIITVNQSRVGNSK